MPKHLKKISEEVLHKNPWTTYKHDVYEKPDGTEGDYFYLHSEGSVFIVPVLADGKIVLTLQHRYLTGKQSIEFPAGKMHDGDSALDAAQRELKEETGCIAEEWIKIGEFEQANGSLQNRSHAFLATVSTQEEQNLDDTEEIELLYRRPDELDAMIRRGDITDGPTLAIWALVRHRFLEKEHIASV